MVHMMRQGPTASMLLSTDLGEMKIPEPMMVPTMMQVPLNRPSWVVERGREELVPLQGGAQKAGRSPLPSTLLPSHPGNSQAAQSPRHLPPVLSGEHQGAAPGDLCVCLCVHTCSVVPSIATPPGSSSHGILQARILEWAVISPSRGSSSPRDPTQVSCISCTGRQVPYHLCHLESPVLVWIKSVNPHSNDESVIPLSYPFTEEKAEEQKDPATAQGSQPMQFTGPAEVPSTSCHYS